MDVSQLHTFMYNGVECISANICCKSGVKHYVVVENILHTYIAEAYNLLS